MKILVIEDDPQVVYSLRLALKVGMPEAELVTTDEGAKGVGLVETESPDIVILDLNLPDMDGMEVLKDIRRFSDVPVIILTVRADEPDVAGGLEMGADDYVTKPWRPLDLIARIRRALRHRQGSSPGNATAPIVTGSLVIDSASRQVVCNGRPVQLTPTQYALLYCLVRNKPWVVPYAVLTREVWGDEDNRLTSIKNCVWELRKKLGEKNGKMIESVRGTGYKFVP